jgi:hypothetical protein
MGFLPMEIAALHRDGGEPYTNASVHQGLPTGNN